MDCNSEIVCATPLDPCLGEGMHTGKGMYLDDFLQLVLQDQEEGTAHAPEDAGLGTLEKNLSLLIFEDLPPAVDGPLVHDVSSFVSWVYQHQLSDRVKG